MEVVVRLVRLLFSALGVKVKLEPGSVVLILSWSWMEKEILHWTFALMFVNVLVHCVWLSEPAQLPLMCHSGCLRLLLCLNNQT